VLNAGKIKFRQPHQLRKMKDRMVPGGSQVSQAAAHMPINGAGFALLPFPMAHQVSSSRLQTAICTFTRSLRWVNKTARKLVKTKLVLCPWPSSVHQAL
jgi:hypothetical protein